MCEELSRRLYFYVGLRKIGGIVVLHPQPYNPADSADLFDQNKLYFFSKSSSYWRSFSQHKILSFFLTEEIKTRKGEEVGKWTVLSDSMGTRSFFNILLQSWALLLQCLSIYQMQTFRIIAFWKCLLFIKFKRFASNIYGSSKVGLTSRLWLISIINWRIACIDFGSLPISLNHFATTTASPTLQGVPKKRTFGTFCTAITVYQLCWPLLIAVQCNTELVLLAKLCNKGSFCTDNREAAPLREPV